MNTTPLEPVRLHGLAFDIAGISEQGPRAENQDALFLDGFGSTGLVAVADGMGGERSGRLAADTALRALAVATPIRSLDEARRAARAADQAVAREAEEDVGQRGGMGCALAFLALRPTPTNGPEWLGAHVGDVRILSRAPDGVVRLETRDHTPAFARWEAGEIQLDEIPEAEGANRLQRAVGRGGEPDALWLPTRPGWMYLLISDGITKAMRLDELGEAMGAPTAAAACEAIRRKVEERGPDDNYTAVVVRVLDESLAPAPTAEATLPYLGDTTLPHPVREEAVTKPRSSALSVLVSLLAVVALAAAGFALWTAWELRAGAAIGRAEIEQLRSEVDSLRTEVILRDPFGPSDATLPPDTALQDTTPLSSPTLDNRP